MEPSKEDCSSLVTNSSALCKVAQIYGSFAINILRNPLGYRVAALYLVYCLWKFIRWELFNRTDQSGLPPPATQETVESFKLNIPLASGFTLHLVVKGKKTLKVGMSFDCFKAMIVLANGWQRPRIKLSSSSLIKCSSTTKNKDKLPQMGEVFEAV